MLTNSVSYSRDKDIILVQFPPEKYDCQEIQDIYNSIKKIFPNNPILFTPDDLTFSIIKEENPFL